MVDLAALARERKARHGVPKPTIFSRLPVHRLPSVPAAKAIAVVILLMAFQLRADPLANGAVPASLRMPQEHWNFLCVLSDPNPRPLLQPAEDRVLESQFSQPQQPKPGSGHG